MLVIDPAYLPSAPCARSEDHRCRLGHWVSRWGPCWRSDGGVRRPHLRPARRFQGRILLCACPTAAQEAGMTNGAPGTERGTNDVGSSTAIVVRAEQVGDRELVQVHTPIIDVALAELS